jgi:predicted dehydrogenase/D-arabinose 1-dehydrogenase-like Zn-dependent alcohol dehydrogenase
VVQDQREGSVSVLEVPEPVLLPNGLLVSTMASVISSGTERAKIEMGEKSLLAKARARPDLAAKVIDQARKDGLLATLDLVRDRLGTPQPLGYSAAGRVDRIGIRASGFEPGDLVAIAGAGYANHAQTNYVPINLAARIPHSVPVEHAAFSTLGSIALHGIRQANLTQGELVVVSGLGLIGQLTVRLLLAYGHPAVGVDPSPRARAEVAHLSVTCLDPSDSQLTHLGADAVLLTAATASDDPVRSAPTWLRDRGRVVVVGDVGLGLTRPPFYDKEVELLFSRSYGPGRYDPNYEEHGQDYPVGYVRWTEGRNLAEFLRLLAAGLLRVDDLIDAEHDLEDAPSAYDRLAHGERARAIVLRYPATAPTKVELHGGPAPQVARVRRDRLRVSLCGAGNFARKTLVPAFESTGSVDWAYVNSATGLSARHVASTKGFVAAVPTSEEAIAAADVDAVVVATRHDTHARLAALCAARKLPAYIEKPLALENEALETLDGLEGSALLTTGFNRRFAPSVQAALPALRSRSAPAVVQMRINAGRVPAGYWADSPEQGGRIVGELCHFIDLACYLVGCPIARISASAAGRRSPQLEDTLQLLAAHADGSVTTIGYFANGSAAVPKERIEAHWEGKSLIIEDFRQHQLDTGAGLKRQRTRRQDKGHAALVARFVEFAKGAGDNPVPFHQAAHTTRVTFAVVESLTVGGCVELPAVAW